MKAILILNEPIMCNCCPLVARVNLDLSFCFYAKKELDYENLHYGKPCWCPLKEVPDTAEELEVYTRRVVTDVITGFLDTIENGRIEK